MHATYAANKVTMTLLDRSGLPPFLCVQVCLDCQSASRRTGCACKQTSKEASQVFFVVIAARGVVVVAVKAANSSFPSTGLFYCVPCSWRTRRCVLQQRPQGSPMRTVSRLRPGKSTATMRGPATAPMSSPAHSRLDSTRSRQPGLSCAFADLAPRRRRSVACGLLFLSNRGRTL